MKSSQSPTTPLLESIYVFLILHSGNCEEFTGQNLAVMKPACQYPDTYPDSGAAECAVDGRTDQIYDPRVNTCTHTAEQADEPAYWTVDMGDLNLITGVRIYNRNILQERLRQFKIYGQPRNVTLYDDATQVVPQYNQAIINVTIDSIQPYRNITVSLPTVEGQNTILTLCEVQIFGDCQVPIILNGRFSGESTKNTVVTAGTRIQASCFTGFKLGNAGKFLTCGYNYTWDIPIHVCAAIMCIPMTLGNGTYTYRQTNVFMYGNVATAKCDKGFKLHGVRQRVCQENETWSGEEPYCAIVVCDNPGHLNNGYYTQDNMVICAHEHLVYNSTITANCLNGFGLITKQSSQRTCTEYGNWTGIKPRCDRTDLPEKTDGLILRGLISSVSCNVILILIIVGLLVCLFFLKKKHTLAQQSNMYMDLAVRPDPGNQEMVYSDISGQQRH